MPLQSWVKNIQTYLRIFFDSQDKWKIDDKINTDEISTSDKIISLAKLRGETVAETKAYLLCLSHWLVPKKLVDPSKLSRLAITETGTEGAYAFVKMDDNMIFYGFPSSQQRLKQYWMIKNQLPSVICAASFGTVLDIYKRYNKADVSQINDDAKVIIEAGAYIGFKAMRFARKIASNGLVIAIEVDPANHALMSLNIEANGLKNKISTVNSGLYSKSGQIESKAGSYQRHSLVNINGLDTARNRIVTTTTLDDIIELYNLKKIDYLNIQVSGAELEVLKGCTKYLHLIRQIGITSKYYLDGIPVRDNLESWLQERDIQFSYQGESKKRMLINNVR
jgi:FkbM family methyltransferase